MNKLVTSNFSASAASLSLRSAAGRLHKQNILLDFNYKPVSNLVINDNKHLTNQFIGKYLNFLDINKGTPVNSKNDLIQLLDKKPRSPTLGVELLVSNLKNYNNHLSYKLNVQKIHPKIFIKGQTLSNKNKVNSINLIPDVNSINLLPGGPVKKSPNSQILGFNSSQNNEPSTLNTLNNLNTLNTASANSASSTSPVCANHIIENKIAVSADNELDLKLANLNRFKLLLNYKIKMVKNSLINNKLSFPINLLNPLVPSNAKDKNKLFNIINQLGEFTGSNLSLRKPLGSTSTSISTSISNSTSNSTSYSEKKVGKVSVQSTLLSSLKIPDLLLKQKDQAQKNNTSWFSQIKEFTKLIEKYNLNNKDQMSNTKFFQLVTAYKVVKAYQQNIRYYFNKYPNINIDKIITLLDYSFRSMSCLISKPVFLDTPTELVINLFYFYIPGQINKVKKYNRLKRWGLLGYLNPKIENVQIDWSKIKNANAVYNLNKKKQKLAIKKAKLKRRRFALRVLFTPKNLEKLNILCTVLSRIFNKTVIFDLIPLKLPIFDDNILVKAIGIICNNVSVSRLFGVIFRKAILYSKTRANFKYNYSLTKSYLSGIKFKIGGRLMSQKVIPRISSLEFQRGPTSHRKVSFVDWSRVVLKNKRGAHSITITLSHVL